MTTLSVDSEIGTLKQVILRRPGAGTLRLAPQNEDALLFEGSAVGRGAPAA